MRFGVIGAGAMGATFGAYLHAAGQDVGLYDVDPRIIETVRSEGLRVERPTADDLVVHPPVTTEPDAFDPVDVALVFVKSPDTARAIEDAAPMLDETTRVVTVQNGLGNFDLLRERLGGGRVLGGYTTVGANTVSPGHLRVMGRGETTVGGEDQEAAAAIAAALTDAGLATESVADPLPHIWDKQFVNVAVKPVAALTELRNGPMAAAEPTQRAIRALVEEAIRVARADGVTVLSEDPVERTLDILAGKHDKKSSILEDVERERPTEIDAINGAVVERGAAVGVPTPYNELAWRLVKGKERSYLDENYE